MSTWFTRTPQTGDVGRITLKSDNTVVIPVRIMRASEITLNFDVLIGDVGLQNTFSRSDWIFEVQNAEPPTQFGSVVKSKEGYLVLTSDGWGNYDYAVDEYNLARSKFEVIFDAGKQVRENV